MSKRQPWFLAAVAFMGVFLLATCNKEDKNAEAKEALKALRKIEAATEVGVNYQQYSQLVIEAQAEVNEAKAKLPDGELKTTFTNTMALYASVRQLWGTQIRKDEMDNDVANKAKQDGWELALALLSTSEFLISTSILEYAFLPRKSVRIISTGGEPSTYGDACI